MKLQIVNAVSSDISLHYNVFQRMKGTMMDMSLINQINLFKSLKKEGIMETLKTIIQTKQDNTMDKLKRELIK